MENRQNCDWENISARRAVKAKSWRLRNVAYYSDTRFTSMAETLKWQEIVRFP